MVGVVATTSTIVVALFALIGPVGTYVTFTPLQRLVSYTVIATLGTPVYYSMMVVTLYYMRYRSPVAAAAAVALALLIGSIPVTSLAHAVNVVLYPSNPLPGPWEHYATLAGMSVACSFLFNYLAFQRIRRAGDADVPPVTDAVVANDVAAARQPDQPDHSDRPDPPPGHAGSTPASPEGAAPIRQDLEQNTPFLKRLPPEARGEIVFLKTENHYVQVYTTAGSGRLLLRFADAVAELGDRGMKVHRSYWVAHEQVLEVVKRDNRTLLRLTGDHEVPVSRTYVAAVQARFANASSARD